MAVHTIPPVFDENSEILILGSFPSVVSRKNSFFYGHPQNRFWRVLSEIFGCKLPKTNDEKRDFLLKHNIALWDVIASCDIEGSADSSIKNVVPNDISVILNTADIKHIFVNGKTAEKHYNKYIRDSVGRTAVLLPSTSPANAAFDIKRLKEEWKAIKNIENPNRL